jgi:uncharacterized protein YaaN involved in tellurite resistance
MIMKKFLVAVVLAFAAATSALAQQPAAELELKAQLAEANLNVAQLKKQISELQISLVIAQRAALPSIDQIREDASKNLTAAVEAAHAARVEADSAAAKKPVK